MIVVNEKQLKPESWRQLPCPACINGTVHVREIPAKGWVSRYFAVGERQLRAMVTGSWRHQAYNSCFRCGARQKEIEALLDRRRQQSQGKQVRAGGDLSLAPEQFDEALWCEVLRSHFDHAVGALGTDHPVIAIGHLRLGDCYYRANQLETALAHYQDALTQCEQAWGPSDIKIADCASALGLSLCATKAIATAAPHLERALKIFEARYSPQHPALAGCLVGLARVKLAARDWATSRDLAARAFAICTEAAKLDLSTLPGDDRLELPWTHAYRAFNLPTQQAMAFCAADALLDALAKVDCEVALARQAAQLVRTALADLSLELSERGRTAHACVEKANRVVAELEKKHT